MKQLLFATATLIGSSVGQYQKSCNSNFERLFAGPADVRNNVKTGEIYTDLTFYRMEQLFWNYWSDKDEQREFVEAYKSRHVDFVRLADKYPAQNMVAKPLPKMAIHGSQVCREAMAPCISTTAKPSLLPWSR